MNLIVNQRYIESSLNSWYNCFVDKAYLRCHLCVVLKMILGSFVSSNNLLFGSISNKNLQQKWLNALPTS